MPDRHRPIDQNRQTRRSAFQGALVIVTGAVKYPNSNPVLIHSLKMLRELNRKKENFISDKVETSRRMPGTYLTEIIGGV